MGFRSELDRAPLPTSVEMNLATQRAIVENDQFIWNCLMINFSNESQSGLRISREVNFLMGGGWPYLHKKETILSQRTENTSGGRLCQDALRDRPFRPKTMGAI
jgi:hypothetical protein